MPRKSLAISLSLLVALVAGIMTQANPASALLVPTYKTIGSTQQSSQYSKASLVIQQSRLNPTEVKVIFKCEWIKGWDTYVSSTNLRMASDNKVLKSSFYEKSGKNYAKEGSPSAQITENYFNWTFRNTPVSLQVGKTYRLTSNCATKYSWFSTDTNSVSLTFKLPPKSPSIVSRAQ